METTAPSLDAVRAAIDRLVEEKRASCLWFVRKGRTPATDCERLALLRSLEARADRETYIRARELRDWLSQLSSGT